MNLLKLQSSDTIQEVQQKFRLHFSHLRPEFYKKLHHTDEGSPHKEQYLHNVTLGELMIPDHGLEISLDPAMPTGQFEQYLEQEFGLHIQIFRLQRGVWLQTTSSDHLSLQEQNQRGLDADQVSGEQEFPDRDSE